MIGCLNPEELIHMRIPHIGDREREGEGDTYREREGEREKTKRNLSFVRKEENRGEEKWSLII